MKERKMRKLRYILLPVVAVALCLTSCYDEMGSKAEIDAKYASTVQPSLTVNSVTPSYYTLAIEGAVSDTTDVIETGVQVSETEDFANYTAYHALELANTFNVDVTSLEENTTYYVRSYAVTRAAGTAVSEAQSVTTLYAPVYDIAGSYTATEYTINDDNEMEVSGTYPMTVAFVEGSTTAVEITNLWGGEYTITGTYDAEANVIYVPTQQQIYDHPTYGPVYAYGVNDSMSAYTRTIAFYFTPKGGRMTSSIWQARVSAGAFGMYWMDMLHN